MEGFNSWSLLALASVGFIVLRDLSSRLLPAATHPLAVSTLSLVVMIPLGFAMLPFQSWEPLTTRAIIYCGVSGMFLSAAFVSITLAMRHGEVAVVAPFRYAILLWAVALQIAIFGIWPIGKLSLASLFKVSLSTKANWHATIAEMPRSALPNEASASRGRAARSPTGLSCCMI